MIEYLNKKGYSKTEAMLRMESSNQDADPRMTPNTQSDAERLKYAVAFGETSNYPGILTDADPSRAGLLHVWIEDNLDVYKVCIAMKV